MKKTADQAVRDKDPRIIVPPPIRTGDTVGLIAPAGSLASEENFIAGVAILKKKGFKVRYNKDLLQAGGYLAGSDRERAAEFEALWFDPEVKALVAARGGYGCLRILDLIDMRQIRENPKILVGFSDLTVLLGMIQRETGPVTYHGPVVTTLAGIDEDSQKSFFNALAGNLPHEIRPAGLKILSGGTARGILLGGNLTTLVHTLGTPFEIPWHRALLFLEDIGEAPYRLDRLLTHLYLAGRFQKIKGLILGTFSDKDRKENKAMQSAVHDRINELLEGCDIPVWTDFPVGHGRRNLTLPVGAEVEMDSRTKSLRFL